MLTLKELFIEEALSRKTQTPFVVNTLVQADNGDIKRVIIQQQGKFYSQILRINDSPVNYAFGHTIDKVGEMKKYITNIINTCE